MLTWHADCARAAGLRYVSDESPGISRRRCGKTFGYRHPNGSAVRDRATLARIRALATISAARREALPLERIIVDRGVGLT